MARRGQYDLNWQSGEDRDVLEIMAAFAAQNRATHRQRMEAIGRAGQERVFLREGHGVGGYLDAQFDAASFHYWGQRLGYGCWNDPQFVAEYKRDNDYCRVKSRPRNPMVSVGINFRGANFNGLKPVN